MLSPAWNMLPARPWSCRTCVAAAASAANHTGGGMEPGQATSCAAYSWLLWLMSDWVPAMATMCATWARFITEMALKARAVATAWL